MSEDKSPSLQLLNEVCDVMDDRQLTEVYLRDGETTLRVRRESPTVSVPPSAPQPAPSSSVSMPSQTDLEDGELIKAPMPGVFYRSAAPDEPFFVNEGDNVSGEDTICLIEAMKIFNPIQPGFSCQIVEVLVENETVVEYDQPLFLIKKT
ncbi:MAG: acetyl-CoA carboxylase, biotin carboxyl carrier protein [Candidatus Poribacteria bacterium]|nr:acetyl-CoA carboxylase, biotin carboxyl carrier protein [Candidatus Poribacteria bacterium]MDE0503509.1 acetyl-CoA carboxylase, biotin carboxyl carrier protein [Candidatus Poribacteria bacterium]